MADRRRVLLVSYFFPPAGGVSVQRALSLTKYLPRDGCEVGVLTALNGAYPVSDPALVREVPGDVTIHHAFTPEPPYQLRRRVWERLEDPGTAKGTFAAVTRRLKGLVTQPVRRVLVPDPQVLWTPFAFLAASRLLLQGRYDTVLVTAPPFSAYLVGAALKRWFPKITLVTDVRDDWFGFFLNQVDSMASEFKRQRAERIERDMVQSSDLVVAVTDAIAAQLRGRHPDQPAEKFAVVPNGFDPAAQPRVAGEARGGGGRMVVTYVGTVYRPCSPRPYLDALESLPAEVRDQIETRFVGRVIDEERPVLENRTAHVRSLGFMPHGEALEQIAQTDYLLLVIDDPVTLSGKVFEYLASGKPILALAPPGSESARLLERARSGQVADPRDPRAIARMIDEAYARFRKGEHAIHPDWDVIRRYERPRLAAEYLALIPAPRRAA